MVRFQCFPWSVVCAQYLVFKFFVNMLFLHCFDGRAIDKQILMGKGVQYNTSS